MSPYNKYFSIDDHVGKVIPEEEFQVLMAEGKIFVTTCRLNGIDAAKATGKPLEEFGIEEREYGGQIVADSWSEAQEAANQRGWGEQVVGTLIDTIPQNETPATIINLNQRN